jgi:hypothetical protein
VKPSLPTRWKDFRPGERDAVLRMLGDACRLHRTAANHYAHASIQPDPHQRLYPWREDRWKAHTRTTALFEAAWQELKKAAKPKGRKTK